MADFIIIGAGIIGSSIALELKKRGASVILLEKAVIGAESSSAAAGMLSPQMDWPRPGAGFDLGHYSHQLYPSWVRELETLSGMRVDFVQEGSITTFTREAALDQAWERYRWQRTQNLPIEVIRRQKIHQRIPGIDRAVVGGLSFPEEAQVDPRRLMQALAIATQKVGVDQRTGHPVTAIRPTSGDAVGVELLDSWIHADRVIVAAGAWTNLIPGLPLTPDAIEPARGQMILLDAGTPPTRPFLSTEDGYIVPRKNGQVLVGSTVERVGYDKQVTAGAVQKLLETAVRTLPVLKHAQLVRTWSGLRPFPKDGQPIIGRVPTTRGLYLATGHYRNGILQAPATAKIVADLVHDHTPAVDPSPFSPARFSPPGQTPHPPSRTEATRVDR